MAMKSINVRSVLRGVFLLSVVLLAGCATGLTTSGSALPSRDELGTFALDGRFSLRQDDRNFSGRLSWKHTATGDEVLLASPFGQGVAQITVNPAEAVLTTSDGNAFSAENVEVLTDRVLGYRLPLSLLADWVRGRDGGADVVERDVYGRLLRLRFEDWRVDYGYDSDDPGAPPGRLFAERTGAFELRLRIDEWSSSLPVTDTTIP